MTSSQSKLKNPTEYHLMALQRQQGTLSHFNDTKSMIEDQMMDYTDCNPTQFLTPSPALQDFDDIDSSMVNYLIPQQDVFSPDETQSEYSTSFDLFQHHSYMPLHHRNNSISSQNDNFRLDSFDQPLSAPAHMGYEFLGSRLHFQPQTMTGSFTQGLVATGSRSLEEYESTQLNQQLLSEKKRRRRESHNAVERRRRENINERIQELGTMLPESMLLELTTVNANGSYNKPNKGAILRKSVDQIRSLQQEVSHHKQRIHELERQLAELST